MVYTERAETAAVSRGTSHVTTKQSCKYTTWVDIQNALCTQKTRRSVVYNHMQQEGSESAREQRIALYKSDQQQH